MQYLEITNISLLESALNQEDYFEDFDRDEGSLIKTTTCVQLSAAFVWKYNLKTYAIQSTEWYWFEAWYIFELENFAMQNQFSILQNVSSLYNI